MRRIANAGIDGDGGDRYSRALARDQEYLTYFQWRRHG